MHEFMTAVKQTYGEKVLIQVLSSVKEQLYFFAYWIAVFANFTFLFSTSVMLCI